VLGIIGWIMGQLGGCATDPPAPRHLDEAIDQQVIDAEEAAAVRALLEGTGLTPADIAMSSDDATAWASMGGQGLVVLALPITPSSLAPLAQLPWLHRLDLAEVGTVPDLPACSVRELRLAGLSADADLSRLETCPQLEHLYLQGDLTSLATLPPLPALGKLVVTRTPLHDLEGLADRPALTTLHVERGAVTSVEGCARSPAWRPWPCPTSP